MNKYFMVIAFLAGSITSAYPQASPLAIGTSNFSVTITTGNTFQTVLSATLNQFGRKSLTIQNNNATDNCWITFGTIQPANTKITAASATKGTSVLLLAGGSYTRYYPYIPADEIEATCASNSDTLYIDVQ